MIIYAKLPLNISLDELQQEVQAITHKNWLQHPNQWHYSGDWTVLALRSPGGSENNSCPDLLQYNSYADTPLMQFCPAIKKISNALQCDKLSIRLMNLKKSAYIKEHRDIDLAFEMGEARLHIPVFTNPEVEFYIEDERVIMQEGECWYMNANRKHKVFNNGNSDRIHLVIDCKVNDWLKDWFAKGNKKELPPEKEMEGWEKIIIQLRTLNTNTANLLANEMENKLKYAALNISNE